MSKRTSFSILCLLFIGATSVCAQESNTEKKLLGDAKSITLQHDTGEMDEYLNVGGAAYTMEFATPKDVEAYVWQVQVYASQFGTRHDSEAVNGDVFVLDENRKIISRTSFPYSLATREKEWISIATLPTVVKGKFYISVDTHGGKYKGLYMGYQKGNANKKASTDQLQGDKIKPADWSKKFAENQWMIRVKIADRPAVYR